MKKNVEHWNNIYETKGPSEVSWTEDYPSYSIEFIESLSLDKSLPIIDIGGGDGLLCRLLRDYDINCFVKDKYATPTYAQGFTEQNFDKPDLVIGFELLEHFPTPKSDLEDLFKHNSNVLLLSTAIYTNEKSDWWRSRIRKK